MEKVKILLTVAIVALLAIVLTVSISDQVLTKTAKTQVTSESINLAPLRSLVGGGINGTRNNVTLTNYPTGWKIEECPIAVDAYRNSTTSFVVNTDYKVYGSIGVIEVLSSVSMNNSAINATYIDYKYCQDGYVNSGFGRSIANLIPGLFVIIILLAVASALYVLIKKE